MPRSAPDTVAAATDETRVVLSASGFSTRVLRAGSGQPVLLLHGNPDSAGEWRHVLAALNGAGRCFAPDLPGFGACDEPPASFDYSRAAHDAFLDELLATLGIGNRERLVLVVHDIGGAIGIPWAAKRLDRIRGLVITNTVVFERFPWFPIAHTWARTDWLGRVRAEAGMWALGRADGRLFRRIFGRASPELGADDIARMTREFALDPKSKRSTLRLFRQMLGHEFLEGADAQVRELVARVPVRVVWGEGDPYIPSSYAGSFQGATVELHPHAGHWVPITRAASVAAAVAAVLAADG
jgi:pimeloyl-ACP methyl ester carboxylesterase